MNDGDGGKKKVKVMVDEGKTLGGRSMYHVKVIDARGRGKGKEKDKMLGPGSLFLVQGQPSDHTSV